MVDEFLNRLASVTGKRYTKVEFGKIINEASAEAKKTEKAESKKADKSDKTDIIEAGSGEENN